METGLEEKGSEWWKWNTEVSMWIYILLMLVQCQFMLSRFIVVVLKFRGDFEAIFLSVNSSTQNTIERTTCTWRIELLRPLIQLSSSVLPHKVLILLLWEVTWTRNLVIWPTESSSTLRVCWMSFTRWRKGLRYEKLYLLYAVVLKKCVEYQIMIL